MHIRRRRYLIANKLPDDITNYPNSGKSNIKPQRKMFEMTEVDYYQGEE